MPSSRWDLTRSTKKIQELRDLLQDVGKRKLLVLAHNNPDPDSIASAWGLQFLLRRAFGVNSILGYGGLVTRAENQAMIHRLRISMKQITQLKPSRYYGIALADAQPSTGNNLVDGKKEPPLIVVDHHPRRKISSKAPFHDIRPQFGATSTIITEYLRAAEITPTRSLANALLYGIKTDTNVLVRGACKSDYEAFNYLSPLTNPRVIALIEKPSLSPDYFVDYYRGLSQTMIFRDTAISNLGNVSREAIIPELADNLLRIEGVSWSLCMGRFKDNLIMSLRSTSRTYRAGIVIRKLVGKRGSAGGHREMAGGQIPLDDKNAKEVVAITDELQAKFLELIDRDHCHPKPLVTPDDAKVAGRDFQDSESNGS